MRKRLKYIFYTLLLGTGVFLFLVFYPRSYNVPKMQERQGVQYWTMSDSSKIAYTFLQAKHNAKSTPVIYLHGGPGGFISGVVIKNLGFLADSGYNVYLYDQVGGGRSSRFENIRNYTVQKQIDDLNEIIQKTAAEKVILIGQSWGGILATLFAADHADKIEKIILTSPGPMYPYHPQLAQIKAPDSLHLKEPMFTNADANNALNNVRTKTMALFATTFGKKLATDAEADAFATYLNNGLTRSCVCDTASLSNIKNEAGSGYYAQVMTFLDLTKIADKRNKIKALNTKVLIMKGQCDNQKWGCTNEYIHLFRNSRLVVIPGAGHYIYVEQPGLYKTTMLGFLNE